MKNNKRGITLLNLVFLITIMLIITATIGFSSVHNLEMQKLDNMYNDIRILNEKVEIYYLKYGKLPILEEYTGIDTIPAEVLNVNDNEKYYKININALENLTLSTTVNNESFFVINEQSHTIYYPKGVETEGKIYFALPEEYTYIP